VAAHGTGPGLVQLLFLRHADAGDPLAWTGPDEDRPLSAKGERQSERVARHLEAIGFTPDAILSSPRRRAFQTAEAVARRVGREVTISDQLGSGFHVGSLGAILEAAGDPRRPLLVGHDPDFSMVVTTLVGAAGITVRKGTLVRIDAALPLVEGEGELRWLIPPDALRER
jgi:phosphohistidine phosphatase SixA